MWVYQTRGAEKPYDDPVSFERGKPKKGAEWPARLWLWSLSTWGRKFGTRGKKTRLTLWQHVSFSIMSRASSDGDLIERETDMSKIYGWYWLGWVTGRRWISPSDRQPSPTGSSTFRHYYCLPAYSDDSICICPDLSNGWQDIAASFRLILNKAGGWSPKMDVDSPCKETLHHLWCSRPMRGKEH